LETKIQRGNTQDHAREAPAGPGERIPKRPFNKDKNTKKTVKSDVTELLKNHSWGENFLIDYCTTCLLPGGTRHHVIEKNISSLVFHREDRDQIIERYLQVQQRTTDTTKTWMKVIANGNYTRVSVMELKRFIEENNNIPYEIPKTEETTKETHQQHDELQHEKAIKKLKNPLLLLRMITERHKQGITGEEWSIMAIVLEIMLRLVPSAKPTSSNYVISNYNGSGKDWLVECICKTIPIEEDYIPRTTILEKVFRYWHTTKEDIESGWTWNGKVIHLKDPPGDIMNSFFKIFYKMF